MGTTGLVKCDVIAEEKSSSEGEGGEEEEDQQLSVDYDDMPSSTALGLGVTIAIVAILVAGGMAAFCAHRGGAGIRFSSHAAHQTLTSFENPIYDAGHVVVK